MNHPDFDPRQPPSEASPGQALAFLWRGRWLIATCTLLAAAGGLALAEHRGTIWRARSVLYVERESPLVPGNDVSLWVQSRNYANTQAALLRSAPIMQSALQSVGDRAIYGDSQNHLTWLQRNLVISVGAQDELITVTLDSPAVDDACDLVNAIVDSYLRFHTDSQRATASAVLTDLTEQLGRYEQELQSVHREQVEFLRAHPGIGPSDDAGRLAGDRYRELNNALTRAEIEVVEAEAAWQAASELAGSAEVLRQLPLSGNGTLQPQPAHAELERLQQQLLQLLSTATPEHPDVKRLQARIAAVEQEVRRNDKLVAEGYVALLENRLRGARAKAAELRAKLTEHESQVLAVNPAQAEYKAIEVRYERARKIADVLFERVRTLDINERLDAASKGELNTLVYERATPSGSTVAASKRTLVAITAFLGLILATGLAWLRSLVDQRLRAPEDLAALLPVLATVPRVGRRTTIRDLWRRQPTFAAAMRSLRTVLQFGPRSDRSRVLQITTPQASDAGSTVTAGLATAMALAGDRVLVVDARLGDDHQARLLGVDGATGLRQVLDGSVDAAAAVVPTEVANLSLLPAGAAPLGGGDLDERLAAVLEPLRQAFDRILIDAPALLVDNDARVVAAICDESVLVLRSGRAKHREVLSALSTVAAVQGRVAGAVLEGGARTTSAPMADIHALRAGGDRLVDRGPNPHDAGRSAGSR